MARNVKRKLAKFVILFCFGAMVFLILVKNKRVQTEDEFSYNSEDSERMKVCKLIDINFCCLYICELNPNLDLSERSSERK